MGPDALPQPVELAPCRAIADAQLLQPGGGARQIARHHRRAPAGQRVSEHLPGMRPSQPVPLKLQRLHNPGGGRQGVERAAVVADETVRRPRPAAHPATGFRLLLAHHDTPARIRQDVRRDQAIWARPDNHRIRSPHTAALCHADPLPGAPVINRYAAASGLMHRQAPPEGSAAGQGRSMIM